MKLQIAKWRDGLALCIPADVVRRLGIKEGDCLEASLTAEGGLTIRPATWDRRAFAKSLTVARAAMPMGRSVMDEVLRG